MRIGLIFILLLVVAFFLGFYIGRGDLKFKTEKKVIEVPVLTK